MDTDGSSFTKIAQETEVDTEHFRSDNRELTEEPLSIIGDSNSEWGEEK